ncbi:hypothetical protein OIU84_018328 [Salix udensis]|uniref:DUF4283 domain-containing protein n=1 Tax=Salix udensis TaxID=889485 RepID=A0AAD6PI99_9ROSI|nr:hypothetical protein OIU84_018328 [Salix udensis]
MTTTKGKHQNQPKIETTSWADRVKVTEASTRFTLEPIPRNEDGRQPEITMDMLTENAEQWSRCMVGFFPGFKMNYHTVSKVANRVWKSSGLESVMSTASGFWIFRFHKEDQMQDILERGPWMFGGKAIVLQQWHPHYVFDKDRISKLPVWVRLHGLPFTLWSRKGLSVAASMVGRPLSCDEQTYCCSRLDYARVCIELDAALPIIHHFAINTPFSESPLNIQVEYEWKPPRCEKCKLFGHVCKPPVEPVIDESTVKKGKAQAIKPSEDSQVQEFAMVEVHKATSAGGSKGKDTGPKPSQRGDGKEIPNKKGNQSVEDSSRCLKVIITHGGSEAAINSKGKDIEVLKDEEVRALKGKAHVDAMPLCMVNEAASMLSTTATVHEEDESSGTNARTECPSDQQDTSPMAFTKVRKKKGGKKNKGTFRL